MSSASEPPYPPRRPAQHSAPPYRRALPPAPAPAGSASPEGDAPDDATGQPSASRPDAGTWFSRANEALPGNQRPGPGQQDPGPGQPWPGFSGRHSAGQGMPGGTASARQDGYGPGGYPGSAAGYPGQPPVGFGGQTQPWTQGPASPSGYPAPPSGSTPAPGFGPQTGFAPQPGAVPQSGYGAGGFGSPGGYPPADGYDPQTGYVPQTGYAPRQQPGFGAPPGYPRNGGYAPAASDAGAPGSFTPGQAEAQGWYGAQQGPAPQNAFGEPRSGGTSRGTHGSQPGLGAQGGFASASGYPNSYDGFAPPPGAPPGGWFPGAGQPGGFQQHPGGFQQQPGGFPGAQQPHEQVPPIGQAGYRDVTQFPGQPPFGGAPRVSGTPQFPGGPQPPARQQFPGGQFPGTAQFQGAPPLAGQPQPGYDQGFGPGGPGGPMPGGPAAGRPGGRVPGGFGGGPPVRRRITDAWTRFGSLTPAAGLAAIRRASGALPSAPGETSPSAPSGRQPAARRNKALVAGAGVLAVVAVGGVIMAPKMLGGGSGSADPGCKAYSGTALTAYNKTIGDMNAQASQSVLSADLATATTELTSAAGQAKSASVKSALTGLVTELQTVKADVQSGTVPASTVNALNAASASADNAC